MTKRFKLFLLDANVVIELFRQGIWDTVVEKCDVYLSRTVAEIEAHFYETDDGRRHDFDLMPYIRENNITVFEIPPSRLKKFYSEFNIEYLEKLDPGESESLAYLMEQKEAYRICSADKIVYRVLGNLCASEKGISLEEILDQIGLTRRLIYQFSKAYRIKWSNKGFEEGIRGIGLKK